MEEPLPLHIPVEEILEEQVNPEPVQEEEPVIEDQPLPEAPIEEEPQPELANPQPLPILLEVPDVEESDDNASLIEAELTATQAAINPEPAKGQLAEHLEDAVGDNPLNIPTLDHDSEDEQSSVDEESSEEEFQDVLVSSPQEQEESGADEGEESAEVAADSPKNICTACQEPFLDKELAATPCNHYYCRECLQQLFMLSFADERLFPPACCEPIPLESILHFLTPEIEGHFNWKNIEFNTKDRTYCSNSQCGQFLFPGAIKGVWEYCFDCKTKTCSMCKKAYHYGTTPDDCDQDLAANELRALGAQNGWQQCPNCNRMVQLEYGCFHITFVVLSGYLFNVLTSLDASARRSFATSAEKYGRVANAHFSTDSGLWHGRKKLCDFKLPSQDQQRKSTRRKN